MLLLFFFILFYFFFKFIKDKQLWNHNKSHLKKLGFLIPVAGSLLGYYSPFVLVKIIGFYFLKSFLKNGREKYEVLIKA